MDPLFREATVADAATLADLARRTFNETFADSNTPEDLARFLDTAYGEAQQGRELSDPAWWTLLAFVDGGPAGFVQLRRNHTEPCVTGPAPVVELNRLYVLQAFQGRRLGAALMQAAVDRAKAEGFRTLWLGVWEHNLKAQAFYRAWGFEDVGSHPFLVGTDLQTDRIWARPL